MRNIIKLRNTCFAFLALYGFSCPVLAENACSGYQSLDDSVLANELGTVNRIQQQLTTYLEESGPLLESLRRAVDELSFLSEIEELLPPNPDAAGARRMARQAIKNATEARELARKRLARYELVVEKLAACLQQREQEGQQSDGSVSGDVENESYINELDDQPGDDGGGGLWWEPSLIPGGGGSEDDDGNATTVEPSECQGPPELCGYGNGGGD